MSILEATPDVQPASPGGLTTQILRLALSAHDEFLARIRTLAVEMQAEADRLEDGDEHDEGYAQGLKHGALGILFLLGDR